MSDLDRKLLHGSLETLVLRLVAEKDCYGYQIRRELAERSHHYFQVAFGRLYPLLRDLQRRGLVTSHWEKAGKVRQRKHYAITAKGRAELADRTLRWRQFVEATALVLD